MIGTANAVGLLPKSFDRLRMPGQANAVDLLPNMTVRF